MSDNITVKDANSLDVTLASKDVGGVQFPKRMLTDSSGNLVDPPSTIVDNAAFTDGTTKLVPAGFILDETAGTALTENDAAAARVDSKRALVFTIEDKTTRGNRATVNSSGQLFVAVPAAATNIAKAEDSASANTDVGVPAMAVRKATPANTSDTDGDYENLQVSGGRLWTSSGGELFDLTSTPTVTNGAYSAGDVVGGAISFTVALSSGRPVRIDEVQIVFKANVSPNLRVIFFTSAPSAMADNAAYSLSGADALKVRKAVSLATANYVSHGTPRSISASALGINYLPSGSTITVYVVDDTGVTLTSTSDMQVRIAGTQL